MVNKGLIGVLNAETKDRQIFVYVAFMCPPDNHRILAYSICGHRSFSAIQGTTHMELQITMKTFQNTLQDKYVSVHHDGAQLTVSVVNLT